MFGRPEAMDCEEEIIVTNVQLVASELLKPIQMPYHGNQSPMF